MSFEFTKPLNAICSIEISKIISLHLKELASNIDFDEINANIFEKTAEDGQKTQVIRINSEQNSRTFTVSNPIAAEYRASLDYYGQIVDNNDIKLNSKKIILDEVLEQFGDLKKTYFTNLEKGNFIHTITNHCLVEKNITDKLGVEKQIEFTYEKENFLIYSYSESKKNNNNEIIYYKFVNFTDDGKSVINSTENYVYGNQRLEIRRDGEGEILDLIEETGENATAFSVTLPTNVVKKDKFNNIIEYREYQYDNKNRIILAKLIKNNTCYFIENTYSNNLIISNYKDCNGKLYWSRVFDNNIKRHINEQLFDINGKLIREEKFIYNKYGDLTLRLDKNAEGKVLSAKEIKYNSHNSPILIINRGKDGFIESETKVG